MSNLRTGSRLAHGGAQYVLATDPGQVTYRTAAATNLNPKIYTDSKATDATGAVSFGLPTGYFTTINYCDVVCMRDTNNPTFATFAMLRSFTTSSVTAQCFESKTTGILLGGNVEGLELATSSLTVMLYVIGV